MLRRLAVIGAMTVSCLAMGVAPAMADGGWTNVTCGQLPQPGCEVGAGTPGKRLRPVRPVSDSGGDGVCHDALGRPARCVHPEYGWMGSDGCYYQAAPDFRPPPGYEGGASGGSGAWHVVRCPGVTPYMSWLPNGAGAAPPSPAVLARQALDRLVLPSPRIRATPAPERTQLVRLPTWLWVEGSAWGRRSATASVPGVSVTVTATPTKVTWTMGDGATVVCHGPGTPYRAGADPRAASPDCGHTYTSSSAGQRGGAYRVTATITWAITWSGGGESGTFPALSTTASARFRVAESQAVITAGRRG